MTTSRLSRPSAPRLSNPASLPWAQMTGGTVTYVNNSDGSVDEVHTFTTAGTLTVTQAGYADVLVCGAGAGGTNGYGGGGGYVVDGKHPLPTGAHAVAVGTPEPNAGASSFSSIGTAVPVARGGYQLGSAYANYTSSISGTSVTYSGAQGATGPGSPGSNGVAGRNGIVIVRTRITPVSKLPVAPNGWATVSGGTVTEYTKPDGAIMEVHTFTAAGTLTVATAGYAQVLIVGAGSDNDSGHYPTTGGHGGRVARGYFPLASGALPVVVAQSNAYGNGGDGASSSLGDIKSGIIGLTGGNIFGAGGGPRDGTAAQRAGVMDDITGASLEYAPALNPNRPGGGGSSSANSSGAAGVVIVAVQKSAPTASGIVASGGTETTYRGDGTNGVNGQLYKVHTFLTSSSLVVTQGGACDALAIGGGGGGGYDQTQINRGGGGGGGGWFENRVTIDAGTIAVFVGAGGGQANTGEATNGYPGQPSAFGSFYGMGGGYGGGSGKAGGDGGSGGGAGGGSTAYGKAAGGGVQGFNATNAYGAGAGGTGAAGGGPGRATSFGGTARTLAAGGGMLGNPSTRAANTGHGGSGGGTDGQPGPYPGSSGIVIVRYPIAG